MSRRKSDSLAGAAAELSTLGAWLEFAVRLYAREKVALGQTAPDAHDEALYLMLHALGWPLDTDRRALTKRLTPAQNEALREMLGRRIYGRVPAAYRQGRARSRTVGQRPRTRQARTAAAPAARAPDAFGPARAADASRSSLRARAQLEIADTAIVAETRHAAFSGGASAGSARRADSRRDVAGRAGYRDSHGDLQGAS